VVGIALGHMDRWMGGLMPRRHCHEFVQTYEGVMAFGFSRKEDERSLIVFLQKFSDDEFMQMMSKRLTDEEIEDLVNRLMGLMKKHLSDVEYHRYFLKE
jgi:hypothetical protein